LPGSARFFTENKPGIAVILRKQADFSTSYGKIGVSKSLLHFRNKQIEIRM